MKQFSYSLISALLFIVISISCNNPSTLSGPSKDFILNHKNQGFQTESITGQLQYHYKGSITNLTTNTYKKVTIYMTVVFDLQNGEQLTDESIHNNDVSVDMTGLESLHIIEMFEPNQTVELDEFVSALIDKKYSKYPVKQVFVSFRAVMIDEINNTKGEVFLKDEDLTQQWKSASAN